MRMPMSCPCQGLGPNLRKMSRHTVPRRNRSGAEDHSGCWRWGARSWTMISDTAKKPTSTGTRAHAALQIPRKPKVFAQLSEHDVLAHGAQGSSRRLRPRYSDPTPCPRACRWMARPRRPAGPSPAGRSAGPPWASTGVQEDEGQDAEEPAQGAGDEASSSEPPRRGPVLSSWDSLPGPWPRPPRCPGRLSSLRPRWSRRRTSPCTGRPGAARRRPRPWRR
jgi:hypothetical protein